MSELLKSGQHPDADQLSAFVEHALPPHEQQQTLAHLAVCSDCRAIVSLALPPVEELPKPQPESARKPWFSGWHLALPVAAAFAALVVIVHIHNATSIKSSATTTQIAVSHPPESVAPLLNSSPPGSVPPLASKTQQSSSRSASPTRAPDRSKSQIDEAVAGPKPVAKLPLEGRNLTDSAQSQPTASNGFVQLHGSASGAAGVATGAGTALKAPATVALGRLQQNASGALPINPAGQSSSATTMSPGQQTVAGAKPAPVPSTTASVDAANQTVDVTSANPVAPLSLTNGLLVNETKIVAAEHPLPSHLPTISTTSTEHQILALDTQNTLFLSDDGGQHWKTISPQWHGRAIKVDLAASSIRRRSFATGGVARNLHAANLSAVGGPVASTAPAVPEPANGFSVTGTVTDTSGAVIPDAAVVVSDATAQIVRSAKTDQAGRYLVDNLTPGSYQVEAQAPGFMKQQLAVTLAASQHSQTNLILPIGQASEAVTVNASAKSLAAQSPAKKKTTTPQPASEPLPVFEITTDAGERWTSPDGQIWKHQ